MSEKKFEFTEAEREQLNKMLALVREDSWHEDEAIPFIESILSARYVSDEEAIDALKVGVTERSLHSRWVGAEWMRSRIFKTDAK